MTYHLRLSFPHDSLYSDLEKKSDKNIIMPKRISVNIIDLKVSAFLS